MLAATVVLILAQLAFVQTLFLRTRRSVAALAFVLSVMVGAGLLHELVPRGPEWLNRKRSHSKRLPARASAR